jgi:CubicO group peptidase (beta-lactamase class C family)
MRAIKKMLKVFAMTLIVALAALLLWLWLKPPGLLRVGSAYAAKIVCSNVFLAGRDADEVLESDVQAPGIALLRLMRVSVDPKQGVVHAGFLGFIGDGLAQSRPGAGCTVLPDGKLDGVGTGQAAATSPSAPPNNAAWPEGNAVKPDTAIQLLLADETLAGPGMRAILVVDHGRIVAERYAKGFTAATPLLGWSMSKTVVAGLIGTLVKDGKLSLDQSGFWPEGSGGRERIRVADLLAMQSGLRFDEEYGELSDVLRMLYLHSDMAAFAMDQPLIHPVGEVWSYSSGTAVILSRIAQDAAGDDARTCLQDRLFAPLGMSSAIIEPDEHGTLVGSSYMYATARDWARYAQFLLQEGVWRGQNLLPAGYVDMMVAPVASSGGQYGHGQVWLWGSDGVAPGVNPDAAFGIPGDTFWMMGHDGQSIAIIRSRQLVVVRLGLTPRDEHYTPQALVKAVLEAAPAAAASAAQ